MLERMKRLIVPLLLLVLIGWLFARMNDQHFERNLPMEERSMYHLDKLTSPSLGGRSWLEPGGKETVDYITRTLEEAGVIYDLQYTEMIFPTYGEKRHFSDKENRFELFRDFEIYLDGRGGGLQFEGEMLFIEDQMSEIDPELIEGRVVVANFNTITPSYVEWVAEHGGEGLLYYTDGMWIGTQQQVESFDRKWLSLDDKVSGDLLLGRITLSMRDRLLENGYDVPLPEYDTVRRNVAGTVLGEVKLGILQGISVDIPVTYHIAEVPSIIARFEGENPEIVTSILTEMDGQGWLDTTEHFEGALNGGASSALLLTVAEELAGQDELPQESIEIVFLNGMMVNDRPLSNYLETRQERRKAAKTILIEKVGYAETFGLSIYYHPLDKTSDILGSHMMRSIRDTGVTVKMDKDSIVPLDQVTHIGNTYPPFFFLTDTHNREIGSLLYTAADTSEIIDSTALASYGDMLLRYVERELFGHLPYTFLAPYFPYLCVVIFLYLLMWGIGELGENKVGPTGSWVHHPLYKVSRGLFGTLAPVITVLLVINGVLNLPPNLNFETLGGQTYTNFSLYEILRGTTQNMVRFFSGLGLSGHQEYNLYLKRSLILIVGGIFLSILFGLIRGLIDGYRTKERASGGALWTILLYSIPDVLISLLALLSVVTLSRWDLLMELVSTHTLRTYVMPVLALVFIPSIYISRMIYVTLREEESKPYIIACYYRGMSRGQVYLRKLSFVAFIKILSSMKGIIMMLLSSLILVEYMFNYPGAMFHLIANRNNAFAVTYYALGIGVIFFAIHLLSSVIHRAIVPRSDER